MKRIYYFLCITTIMVVSAACNKGILDTAQNNVVASANMWTTDGLTDQGVAGVYAALRLGSSGGGHLLYELWAMDRFGVTGQDYDNGNNDNLLTGIATTGWGYFSDTWKYLYEGISRSNDAIKNIPLLSPSTPQKKSRLVAECKFLRAYFYFRLAELYQNVPIYTEPTAYNQFGKSSSPRDSVWMQVINDLSDAINEPNLPSFYASGNSNWGHVTKGAAYALRGEVFMWQKKYDLAIADFQKVKDAGYSLFTGAGVQSYKMLFKQAQNQCSEMIFSMQNNPVSGYGGTTEFYCGTRSSFGSCWDWYSPSNFLVELYENADGSKFNWDDVIPGYNEMSPAAREVYFIRNNATTSELAAAQGRGADVSKYDPDNNESRIKAAYAGRDPRLQQTIITPYSEYLGNMGADQLYTLRWPYRTSNSPTFDIQADAPAQKYGLYWYRKFVYEGGSEGALRNAVPINYPIIRYADVLLQWAEALNESQGISQTVLDLVNQVRSRAGMPGLQMTNSALPTYVANTAEMRQRIRNERFVEFPLEGVTYFDELRWGTWKDEKFGTGGPVQMWGKIITPYTWQGDYITTWPVPTSVVQITNGKVAQTPGWLY